LDWVRESKDIDTFNLGAAPALKKTIVAKNALRFPQ
jgi:hypothetical protein